MALNILFVLMCRYKTTHSLAMHTADCAVARCPSVCLSTCVRHTQLLYHNGYKCPQTLHRRVTHHSRFFYTKRYSNIPTGTA